MMARLPPLILLLHVLLLLPLPLAAAPPASLLLATHWDGGDPTGWWMSEKLDGIRGYWDGEQMWTRGGKAVVLPETLRLQLPPFALDGELWAGHDRFGHVQETVLDAEPGPGWAHIRYHVFDLPEEPGLFPDRLLRLQRWLKLRAVQQVEVIPQQRCLSETHLQQFLAGIEAAGGEGVMLRAPDSAYETGRSRTLQKVKSFGDIEVKVIGHNPGRGRLTGQVGSLQVETTDGIRFAVGSGLSDKERQSPPPIGASITVKHWGWTTSGKPRFPVYWRQRTDGQ